MQESLCGWVTFLVRDNGFMTISGILARRETVSLSCVLYGALVSNAIHVNNVAAAIEQTVLHWPESGIYNLFDQPNSTWRAIFDWHSMSLGSFPYRQLRGL